MLVSLYGGVGVFDLELVIMTITANLSEILFILGALTCGLLAVGVPMAGLLLFRQRYRLERRQQPPQITQRPAYPLPPPRRGANSRALVVRDDDAR